MTAPPVSTFSRLRPSRFCRAFSGSARQLESIALPLGYHTEVFGNVDLWMLFEESVLSSGLGFFHPLFPRLFLDLFLAHLYLLSSRFPCGG